MNLANTSLYTGTGIRQVGNIWKKSVDEVSYHKTDELVMGTGVPTVEIAHDVSEKHKDDKLAPDPENAAAEGVRALSMRARSLCLQLLAPISHTGF